MGVTFVKRSSIPVSVKGKQATKPTVGVGSNGQIVLNTLASKHFNGSTQFALAVDQATGTVHMYPKGAKAIAKVPEDQLFDFKVGKKTKTLFLSATNLLRSAEVFGDHIYDYAKSGNQTFDAVIDEKTQALTFALPKGSLTPKPVTPRKKKEKVAPGTVANPGSTVGTPVAEDDLALDLS